MSKSSSTGDDARGYEPPNYTQIPNSFLDKQLPKIKSLAELKVVMAIMRQTFGWHKDEDELSISQLEKLTGLSRQSVTEGVSKALEHKLIKRRQMGHGYAYRLNVKNLDTQESGSQESRLVASQESRPEVVKNLDPQKKVLKKEKERTTVSQAPPEDSESVSAKRTESQQLTDEFYNRIKGRYRIPLEKEQYQFHLGQFRNMLKKYDDATDEEKLRVLSYMVDEYPSQPKIRAPKAMEAVRLGRDTGEAWEREAPWEKVKREAEPNPYKNLTDFTGTAEKPPKKMTEEEKAEVKERISRRLHANA